MSKAGPSNISQGSILELRAIAAEHVDRFTKEGRSAVKCRGRRSVQLDKSKDPFDRPSPGLVKRLAAEARNDAKRRHFQDEGGPNAEQRRDILAAKAKIYEAMSKGDYSALTDRELAESNIDFERKLEEDGWSDHSDVDESAIVYPLERQDHGDLTDDLAKVEYIDEMGRTRIGSRKEAREAEVNTRKTAPPQDRPDLASAYTDVLASNVIYGDQSFFPVYEPDPDAIKAKYRAAEEEARAHHYDSTKEVRAKGAGQYQFSLDEEKRAEQMASLDAQRLKTEQARGETAQRGGISAAQEAKKRKLEDRKALIEAKRVKLLGGEKEVERLRAEKRAAEAEQFLQGLEAEIGGAAKDHE